MDQTIYPPKLAQSDENFAKPINFMQIWQDGESDTNVKVLPGMS